MRRDALRAFQELQLVQQALSWSMLVGELETGEVLQPRLAGNLGPYLTVMALFHIADAFHQFENSSWPGWLPREQAVRFLEAWADADLKTLRNVYQHYAEKIAEGPSGRKNRDSFGEPLGSIPFAGESEPIWQMSSAHGPDGSGVRGVTVLGRHYELWTSIRAAMELDTVLHRALQSRPR